MKKKSTSRSAFFNPRALIGLFLCFAGVLIAFFAFGAPTGGQQPYKPQPDSGAFTFTTIDVPGATDTGAGGINNLAHIVGGYILPDGTKHGFLDVGGTFTTIDDPNAAFGTFAIDINSTGQIAGTYDLTDPDHEFEGAHGFLLSGGTFTPIDFPLQGVTSTTPQGINDSGDVVGLYRMNGPGNGFLYSGGTYTTINVPTGCCTHAIGINNAGQIVGQYKTPDDTAPQQGFLKTGSTFTTINFPGAETTTLQGINNFGDIVGFASMSNTLFGFLLKGGSFFTIAFPGAVTTQATHINDNGDIVGFYQDTSGRLHGFRATMAPPVITSPATATATQGQLFVYQVTATGTPTNYTATPLPPGLTFDSVSGILGGTPTNPGTTQIQLTASNSGGTGMATLTLTVQPAPSSGPVVMSGTSITGRTGVPFSFEVFTTGGSPSARLSVTGLPPGLSVDPVTGIISGTPTADGSSGVTLTVTDGAVTTISTLQLTFTSDPAIPVIISPREATLAAGQFFTYTIMAPSSNQSGTTFTLIGTLPLGLVFDAATGTISGTYNPQFQNGGALLGNVQLIATNSSGTATSPLSFFEQVSSTAKNISTRLAVGTSDNVLIGGIIIQGNAPKKVIIRAIGPSLTAFGVPGALQDPTLELHDVSGALIGQNDNWGTTIQGGVITSDQVAEIQASGLAPGDSHESAIIATLQPGNYTAIIRGEPDGTTGVALVEAYDLGTASLDVSSNAQLGNISTRGLVQTGDNVMIGGFIVQGDMPATVIVRAIGPSLTAYGVQGALQDPTLELHDESGAVIGTNDNWQDDPGAAQIQADHLAPSDPRESATIVTLDPGNYTAIVRGANGTTGVALVEAYVLP